MIPIDRDQCIDMCLFVQEQALYQPQTEAISPSLEEPKNDSNMRDSTIIRNSISKLDSDIQIAMKKLHRARLSQVNNGMISFLVFILSSVE